MAKLRQSSVPQAYRSAAYGVAANGTSTIQRVTLLKTIAIISRYAGIKGESNRC